MFFFYGKSYGKQVFDEDVPNQAKFNKSDTLR